MAITAAGSDLGSAIDMLRRTPTAGPPYGRTWRWGIALDGILLTSLLMVTGAVSAWGLRSYPALNGDEGIYTEQAHAVLHGALSPYTYTYDHPFFGWVQLAFPMWIAQKLQIGGPLSIINARAVMVLLQLTNVMLLYGVARRMDMRRASAVLTVLLFGLSPLTVVLTRQVYLDNLAMPWLLLSIFLVLNRSRSLWQFSLAGGAFAISVLSKETILLFLPALVYLLHQRTAPPLRVMAATATAALFSTIVLVYPLFALLRGELLPGQGHVSLWSNGIMYQLASRRGSGAIWTAGSDKQRLLQAWLASDRILLIGGFLAVAFLATHKPGRWLTVAILIAAAPIVQPNGYLPAMYVACLLPFCALAMGATVDRAFRILQTIDKPRLARTLAPAALLAACSVALGVIAPAYAAGDRVINTVNLITPEEQTRTYLLTHTTAADTVLTDDAFVVDLNRHGLTDPWHQTVSYYKYDFDPTARRELPRGYREFTYVVDTPEMRANMRSAGLKYTRDVVLHSLVVASYGKDEARIEIRRIR